MYTTDFENCCGVDIVSNLANGAFQQGQIVDEIEGARKSAFFISIPDQLKTASSLATAFRGVGYVVRKMALGPNYDTGNHLTLWVATPTAANRRKWKKEDQE